MVKSPFSIVKDFEDAVAVYTGAPYAVAVNSCTNALFLCLKYHEETWDYKTQGLHRIITIPSRTYASVPQQILHAGFGIKFEDTDWQGVYQLAPLEIYDAAKRFRTLMYRQFAPTGYVCTSHHWNKILGVQQGGMILHSDYVFDAWARKARFDGRTEGKKPSEDNINSLGWHMYMSPEVAAEGLVRLSHLPEYNEDMPVDDYPDLSKMDIFKK